jgi:hypothetical protein
MCVCIPPAVAPFLLPLLEWLAAASAAVLVPAVLLLLGAAFGVVRGLATLIWLPIESRLERRSDRLWNAGMAELQAQLRAEQSQSRQRVDVTVVKPVPAELDTAAPLAIEADRPQLMPASVRMYATPREELTR